MRARGTGNNQPQNRFLVNLKTATTTITSTITSTVTTASVVSCIPSAEFSASAACRRRRGIEEADDVLEAILASAESSAGPTADTVVIQADLPKPFVQISQF